MTGINDRIVEDDAPIYIRWRDGWIAEPVLEQFKLHLDSPEVIVEMQVAVSGGGFVHEPPPVLAGRVTPT